MLLITYNVGVFGSYIVSGGNVEKQESLIESTEGLGWAISNWISLLRLLTNAGGYGGNKRLISFQSTQIIKSSEIERYLTKELKERNFWLQPGREPGFWTVLRDDNRVGEINIKNTTDNENIGLRFVSLEIIQDTAH